MPLEFEGKAFATGAVFNNIDFWNAPGINNPEGFARQQASTSHRLHDEQLDGLTHFIEEPRAPLSNNAAERCLRGPVVGRKNHHGSKSQRGTEVAALFYSLIESAKLVGVDPEKY